MMRQANQKDQMSHVQAYRNSDLSKRDYCRLNKITYHQLSYWLSKFTETATKLVPVRIEEPQAPTETVLCSLQLKQGLCLKIHDLNALNAIIGVLNKHVSNNL